MSIYYLVVITVPNLVIIKQSKWQHIASTCAVYLDLVAYVKYEKSTLKGQLIYEGWQLLSKGDKIYWLENKDQHFDLDLDLGYKNE